MKTLLVALASVSLLATSLAAVASPAEAQARRGGFHVGARGAVVSQPHFRGGGGFRGGYAPGWGYRGGYGGYRGYSGAWAGAALGFALGTGLAYQGYYGYPGYAYYPDYGYYGGYVSPVPQGYVGDPWAYDYGTSQATPPAAGAQPAPQACGSWSWDPAQSKYNWIPCPPSGG